MPYFPSWTIDQLISSVLLLLGWLVLGLPMASAQDTTVIYYPNTDQRWEKIYRADQKMAENIYYPNEQPWMTVRYQPSEERQWKWYHDNGNPYFEATIIDDLLQGTYTIWYENGQVAERLFFRDNVENGPAQFYHSNGQLAMSGTYQDGKMVGIWQFYNSSGQLADGAWTWPFAASTNANRMEGQLQEGRRSGQWMYQGTANLGRANQLRFTEQF